MFKLCNFCLEKVTAKDAVSVKDLMIDKSPGFIKLTEILVGVSLEFTTKSELICERCLDSVINFFKFKENLRLNIKEPVSLKQKSEKSEIEEQVSDFLEKSGEEVTVISHHRCLCLVPESSLNLMKYFVQFDPSISIDRDPLKVEQKISNDPLDGIVSVTKFETLDEFPNHENQKDEETDLLVETKIAENVPKIPKKRGRKRKVIDDSIVIETKRQTRSINYNEATGCGNKEVKTDNHSVDSLVNYQLNDDELKWLKEQISSSRFTDKFFTCSQCHKILKSYAACRYHIISKHIKTRDSTKEWISQRIKEGEEFTRDGKVLKYKCIFCSKTYPNASGLRYHLKSHVDEQEMVNKLETKNEQNSIEK